MLSPLPAATHVTVALALPLSNAAVAALVLLDVTLFVPLQLPQLIVKLLVVVGYVSVPLVGLNVIVHVPLFTVNAYVLLDAR